MVKAEALIRTPADRGNGKMQLQSGGYGDGGRPRSGRRSSRRVKELLSREKSNPPINLVNGHGS